MRIDTTTEELLAQAIAAIVVPPLSRDEYTRPEIQRMIERTGIRVSMRAVEKLIEDMVERGIAVPVGYRISRGKRALAWRITRDAIVQYLKGR